MDILEIRTLLRTKPIYDIPMRVTFYARVSSDSDEQLNSLDNQIAYYENFIKKNEKWIFVPGYIDEGLSGISTKKRKHFNEMISDAKNGMFDLIITKEISRFARNTLDSLQYTRQLLGMGVGVFFQNDNINTRDEDAELRLTIMSSIAQDELRKLSSRVKFGHQQAIKSSVVLGNSRIFGYKKDDKRLVIDETQAPMVRDLFRLYSTGQYSMKQLEKRFYDEGYRNYNGNRISHTTMSGIISNPKYKGYYVGNKVRVVDMFTKKQKFLPKEDWVMYKDETGEIVPALVSEEIWERANEVLARRSEDVKNRQGICNHANLLTGKLFCTHCGKPYYRRESKDKQGNVNSKWVCAGKINNGADSCPSFPIYESEIKPILLDVFSATRVDTEAMLRNYTEMFRSMENDDETAIKIDELKKTITLAEQKKNKLLELVTLGTITAANFKSMTDSCDREIDEANAEIAELEKLVFTKDEYRRHMSEVRTRLDAAVRDAADGLITNEFVAQYIDKIMVTITDDDTANLKIRIFTGKSTERWLSNLAERSQSRAGHTFKKMIEKYENDIKASK
ncbi:MAG: recombinase family protein [Candidatus Flemingibacterium sp.]|nr:recombinase family protein [Candidatus Flemingibacterium sp.]